MDEKLKRYIRTIPKAELHVHVEGTLEPELMFKIAKRNNIHLEGTVESHIERRKTFKASELAYFYVKAMIRFSVFSVHV